MLNRKQTSTTTISFEGFALSPCIEKIGDFVEVPMNAFGTVVARYRVTAATVVGSMVVYAAEFVC